MLGVIETPPHLAPFQQSLGESLARVQQRFDAHLRSGEPAVDDLCRHVERYRGKMLRPILTLTWGIAASEYAVGNALTASHETSAAVVEMVHMATLVHDDILDEADVRRGARTINALRGNEAAVMLGDLLIAAAYDLANTLGDIQTSRLVSRAAMTVCQGELIQLHNRAHWAMDEATYFRIVSGKTGALIACACELGALHSGANNHARAAAATYGNALGIAFQIQDDLLDLVGDEKTVGKSVRKDIEKSKLTLPLIHHLRECGSGQRDRTLALLEGIDANAAHASQSYDELVKQLTATGSIEYAAAKAQSLVAEAKQSLAVLAPGPGPDVLALMADAVIRRNF
jgi:octaprenyl-diphosphate synthase